MQRGSKSKDRAPVRLLKLACRAMAVAVVWGAFDGPGSPLHCAAATYTVTMDDFQYQPNPLIIGVGDTVIWRNSSGIAHSVTGDSGSDPVCGTTILLDGRSCSRTFSATGTNFYHCTVQPFMTQKGVVIVVPYPSVTITNPATNSVFAAPATFSLRANASVASGTIKNVVLKSGTNTLITLTNTPYSVTLSNTPAGAYAFTAVATDSRNFVATSAVVNVSVVTPVAITNSAPLRITNGFSFRYTANSGLTYVVQGSTNLTNWTSLSTNKATNNPQPVTDLTATNMTQRYYRVLRLVP